MTPSEWAKCCALITKLWPHRPMPPESVEAWYLLLADLDGAQVAAAIQACALRPGADWPPSVGALRDAAMPPRRDWEDAIAELRATVRAVGAHASPPAFSDPALARVVAVYGWERCCWQNTADPVVRAQFREAYRAAQEARLDGERRGITAGTAPAALGIAKANGVTAIGQLLPGTARTA